MGYQKATVRAADAMRLPCTNVERFEHVRLIVYWTFPLNGPLTYARLGGLETPQGG